MTLHEQFTTIPYSLDVVNIGSGPSFHDFNWSSISDIKGYNMAIAPEDFRYDARIIKNYGHHLKEGGIVVIVVCPLSFGKNEYLYKDRFSEKYVSILPQSDVDLPKWKYSLYKKWPISLKIKSLFRYRLWSHLRQIIEYNGNSKDQIESLVSGWISDNKYLRNLTNPEQANYYRDAFKEKQKDLKKVIVSCQEQKLVPVLVIPPMSLRLRENISDDFIKAFVYDNLTPFVDDDVILLDYINENCFQDDKDFTNGLFLCSDKSKEFTRIVWSDIQNKV